MAYSTGSYTDQDNALALFYAWALTNGWTQNFTGADGTGIRAHISKNISGTNFFFNLRSAVNEFIADVGGTIVRGIGIMGSTAWDGSGTDWDKQTGFTTSSYQGSSSTCGNIDALKSVGGSYHFFATTTTLSAVFETESDQGDWRMFTIGSLGGYIFYCSSGSFRDGVSAGLYDARSSYCAKTSTGTSASQLNSASIFVPTEGWYGSHSSPSSSTIRIVQNLVDSGVSITDDIIGSTTAQIVAHTPDSFRGNAQLVPSSVTITKGLGNEYWPVGDIEGVKFVNMTNYDNEDEITYDTNTYKLFRIYNPSPTGVAFLK